ncbi:MAG: RNA methyltransferase [Candidatus Ancillula sp.]|jgi:TrmH family RNA methyltransferase|nr:RNA methyltransferase [Candidatus Ancillula sp.]
MYFTNINAQRIKNYRTLEQKKVREKSGRLLVEGVNAVEQAIKLYSEVVECIIVQDDELNPRILNVLKSARKNGVQVDSATQKVMDRISKNAMSIIAIVKIPPHKETLEVGNLAIICSKVSDPGNAGVVIRSAVAFGASVIIFVGDCVDYWSPKVIRSSVGAVFGTPILNISSFSAAVDYVKKLGYSAVCADVRGSKKVPAKALGSTEITQVLQKPTAWIFGSEAHGLEEDEVDLADFCVAIPMPGTVESLNLAGAVHICLYETIRSRNEK